jgi:hypothetical protein
VPGHPADVLALEHDPAAGQRSQPGDRLQGGGLAGAVRADQGHDLALVDGQRDVLQSRDLAVVHGDRLDLK